MTVKHQATCPPALSRTTKDTITIPRTITVFPGTTVTFPLETNSFVSSYAWLLGASDFDVSIAGAPCSPSNNPRCTAATREVTQTETVRLRLRHACQQTWEDSATIFFNMIPCSAADTGTTDDRPSFDITVDAPGALVGQPFTLRAPAGLNARYQWFEGLYPDGTRIDNGPAEGSLEPTFTAPGIAARKYYYAVVAHTACDPNAPPKKFHSVALPVNPCSSPTKRRAVSSCQAPCKTIPYATVRLSVPDDHDGTTFTWYEGNDYADTSKPAGTGPSIMVSPSKTTSYWVRISNGCAAAQPVDSDFIVVEVACSITITKQPDAAAAVSSLGSVSTSVEANGNGRTLRYQWYGKDPQNPNASFQTVGGNSATYTWTHTGPTPAYRDVYVDVSIDGLDGCTVSSRTVRLSLVPTVQQSIFGYTSGATVYSESLPEKLMVVMDPPASNDHVYTYDWYRDNGTPAGEQLTSNSTSRELLVTTASIDTFWVVVHGTHTYSGGSYQETSVSKHMYVSLYGTCLLPPLTVTQSAVTLTTDPVYNTVTFLAMCDWPGVEFEWYQGQTGDTRYDMTSDLGKPNQLTVPTGSIHPYWVRAKLACGAVLDSPTLTFRREPCGPTLINQNVQSVEVPYDGTARLYVDPLVVNRPSYTWYQNEGQDAPVYDDDQIPTTLKLDHVQKSGRYYVLVRNLDCSNADESYMATVRVASHPAITPPATWQTVVWTDSGTRATVRATSGGATHYQWFAGEVGDERPGRLIPNEMSDTYLTPPLTSETKYWARVYAGTAGNIDSPTITVRICERPRILNTSTPTVNLLPGQAAYLDVEAAGTNLTYQWYVGGTPGDPATGTPIGHGINRLLIKPYETTTYWLLVTGHCGAGGADTSSVHATFTASVCVTPVITAEPQNQPIFSGATATLSVAATEGTATPLTYQWYRGGGTANLIQGATSSAYTTPALTAATSYWVRVTAGHCSIDSALATVSMCAYPSVLNAPDDRDIAVGQTTRLTATISPIPQQVRWYLGAQGDRANPIGSLSYVDVSPTVTSQYWGEFTHDGCAMKSRTVTVYVSVPTIAQQPASVQVNNGQTATLTVAANTTGLTYQWYAGTSGSGTAISGATSASFTTPPMTTTTSYWVKVTGSRGHIVNSDTATVSVCVPASIGQEPSGASIRRGTSTTLSVGATGTNLRYQWYRATAPSETNPSGSTAAITVSPADPANYWVKVTSDCGAKNSVTASVAVCVDPTINTQPATQTIYSGATATLSVAATAGTALPLSYQWYSGASGSGTPISGAISATYTTAALTATTDYWVKVTSGVCSTNSATATVSICAYNPTLNAPDDRDIAVGETVRLSTYLSPVPASGQWFRGAQGDRTNLISSTTYADVSPTVTTQYWGEFTHNGCTTKTRTVTVYVSIPTITQQPAPSTQVNAGQSATLTVAANTAGLTYQWYSGTSGSGTAISGATSATYVTPALAGGSAASYWAKVTGSRGHTVNSNTATVTWCAPASISQNPVSASIRRGSSVSMTVGASGTNLRYQWYRATSPNEVNAIGSATASQYNVVPLDTESYWVKVTSDCGAANSTTARIDVCLDPTINTPPASQTINTGSTATLSVAATANTTLGLTYQWYSGTTGSGTAISGATSPTFTTPALTSAANYWVRVTSGVCSTDSTTAAISICPYPATVNAPSDRNTRSGVASLLSISLSPAPQTWKWYRGAQGDRSNLLSSQPSFNVYPTVTTQYWGEFTYNGCTTKSRTVTINVCIPTITAQPQSPTIWAGTSTTLSVSATEATSYQWYNGSTGQPISGATSPTYTTPVLWGNASYFVRVNGSCGIPTDSDYVYVTVQ